MNLPAQFDHRPGCVYGEPYQTPDGSTVITVSRVRNAAALGAFVIRGDEAKWVPVVDANRIALIGVTTGLLSAVICSLAVLRRPPWPVTAFRRG